MFNPGDRVGWHDNATYRGTVISVQGNHLEVKWDDIGYNVVNLAERHTMIDPTADYEIDE